ncbi:methyltransferase domain-containing protein [Rhodonellum sp.]|uniref:methyltransferase domain-containing protein n=1 Tax=Rhodonellum sp. TaxID=2231180 RepID=UPI00271E5179|nr:methyltransferase domain-containing protein [Rhodonellum sp.]MDO9551651.1 methyltransferase domain-containing protein [Rhodonellum sp.]
MSNKFSKRSYQKEIMDDLEVDGPVLSQTLKELRTINKLLGGNYVTTNGLAKIMGQNPQPNYVVADIGCGGGDMIRVMADWAKKTKNSCAFIGIDANANTIEMAQNNLRDLPEASFKTQNIFDPAFADEKVDLITCTLFTHHFTDEELILLLNSCKGKAKLGIIINDLHRHPVAYFSIRFLTRLFSRSTMVKHDGPLSVLRGFKRSEWHHILNNSGFSNFEIRWNWAFRWQVICFI